MSISPSDFMSIALITEAGQHQQEQHATTSNEADNKEEIEEIENNEDAEDADEDDEDDDEESEDEDEDDDDDDEELIARKLNEQLLEDIRRARAAALPAALPARVRTSPKEEAALATIKTVLAFAASDPLVHSTLSGSVVPDQPNSNVLNILKLIVKEGRITPQIAGSLSHVLVKLAKSEVLFSPLPSLASQTLKRKRGEGEERNGLPAKRATTQDATLQTQSSEAVQMVVEETVGELGDKEGEAIAVDGTGSAVWVGEEVKD